MLDANEQGVAVEMLSEALVRSDAQVSREVLGSLEGLVDEMGLDRQIIEDLLPPVTDG